MSSPFPGMNPFLEQADVWQDFHDSFLHEIRDTLVPQVGPNYIAKVEEQLYIHEPPAESRRLFGRADVSVGTVKPENLQPGRLATMAAPAEVTLLEVDIERLRRIEIRDRMRRQLVTVIELLSPTNKYTGADRDQYIAKRGEILASRVHFVEIDLLRGGPRIPVKEELPSAYCALVSRAERRPHANYWPIQLRERLPVIPIPLREGDADARIDLQDLLNRVYTKAGYHHYIYSNPPDPPLSKDDAEWARQYVPPLMPA